MTAIDSGTIEAKENLTLISKPTTAVEYICLNNQKPPFHNKVFRKALDYAIDRQSIIDSVYLGRAKITNSIVNPNVFGFYDGLKPFSFDPKRQKH